MCIVLLALVLTPVWIHTQAVKRSETEAKAKVKMAAIQKRKAAALQKREAAAAQAEIEVNTLSQQDLLARLQALVAANKDQAQNLPSLTRTHIFELINRIQDQAAVLDALHPLFAHWMPGYEAILRAIRSEGYSFANLDDYTVGMKDRKLVFMRYDIHIWDSLAAIGVMEVNKRLGVPGVYYITWEHSPSDVEWRPNYLALKRFAGQGQTFGLHASPASAVIIRRLGGMASNFNNWISSGQALTFLQGLTDNQGNLTQAYWDFHKEVDAFFLQESLTFLEEFPDSRTVTGHGTPFGRVARQAGLDVMAQLVHAPSYLGSEVLERAGWIFEGTRTMSAFSSEGSNLLQLQLNLVSSMGGQSSFVQLMHPVRLQKGIFDDFWLPPVYWHVEDNPAFPDCATKSIL